ncbi:MAG: HD domain-containing protein [Crocinitomicaceae bacterium]
MRENILSRLENELPTNLSYHDINHTLAVEKAALKLGEMENLSEEDFLILRTAILYHDAGYVVQYTDNEKFAKEMVRKDLPEFGYSNEQIQKILNIIHSTQRQTTSASHLDELMSDCDHDYFGRNNYTKIAQKLRDELAIYGTSFTDLEWVDFQLAYVEGRHKYLTKSALELLDGEKKLRIQELKNQRLTLL